MVAAEDGGSTPADAGAETRTDAGTVDDPVAGLALVERIAGLWSGPATRTPLGDFTMMNVDFRPASDQFVFGRVDVDEDNALRFGFSVETHDGTDVLTYRNGGFFLGLLRDDRTRLVEHDPVEGTYRFCHVDRGCDYIDAVYDFEGDDRLVFDVFVRGNQHVYWDARRLEERAIPDGLVEGLASQGTGDAPFAPMPDLRATVRWSAPLAQPAPVWLLLTVDGCSFGGCNISRSVRVIAAVAATTAELRLPQVHAGRYQVLAVLDRNANLDTVFAPDSGDGISVPNTALTVAPSGETTTDLSIAIDLP